MVEANEKSRMQAKNIRQLGGRFKEEFPSTDLRKHTSRRRSFESSTGARHGGGDFNRLQRSRTADTLTSRPNNNEFMTSTASSKSITASQVFFSAEEPISSPRRKESSDAHFPSESTPSRKQEQKSARGRPINFARRNKEIRQKVEKMDTFETTPKVQSYEEQTTNDGRTSDLESNDNTTTTKWWKKFKKIMVQPKEDDWRNSVVGWVLSCIVIALLVGSIVAYFASRWWESVMPASLELTFSPTAATLNPSSSPSTSPPSLSPSLAPTATPTPGPTKPPTPAPSFRPSGNPSSSPTEEKINRGYYETFDRAIRIACVGDSLTRGVSNLYGLGAVDYPRQLQGLLGGTYTHRNLGINSVTAIRGLSTSYTDRWGFETSLAYQPDIYLLMLGTNDSKYWETHGQKYRSDMEWIVKTVKAETGARIIVGIPPYVKDPASGYGQIRNQILVNFIQPAIRDLAISEKVEIVDMYKVTVNEPDALTNDGVHLNEKGYGILAEAWRSTIQCNQNGICDVGENCTTCPRDCFVNCPGRRTSPFPYKLDEILSNQST